MYKRGIIFKRVKTREMSFKKKTTKRNDTENEEDGERDEGYWKN